MHSIESTEQETVTEPDEALEMLQRMYEKLGQVLPKPVYKANDWRARYFNFMINKS
jgi:hypothetical protein